MVYVKLTCGGAPVFINPYSGIRAIIGAQGDERTRIEFFGYETGADMGCVYVDQCAQEVIDLIEEGTEIRRASRRARPRRRRPRSQASTAGAMKMQPCAYFIGYDVARRLRKFSLTSEEAAAVWRLENFDGADDDVKTAAALFARNGDNEQGTAILGILGTTAEATT